MDDTASYACPTCGEVITIYVDISAGRLQEYVEDCPVCCRPNVIRLELGHDGTSIDARSE